MSKLLSYLTLFIIIFASYQPLEANETFTNERHNINAIIPHDWSQKPYRSSRIFHFEHASIPATISITVHTFPEVITLNAFQLLHVSSRFDGWQNVFERAATPEDIREANVDEGNVAVYRKNILNDGTLQLDKWIVGEYYYLVDQKKGYVVTLRTLHEHWKKVQPQLKFFIRNFWVGDERYSRSESAQKDLDSQFKVWGSVGGDSSNRFSTSGHVALSDGLNQVWKIGDTFSPDKNLHTVMNKDSVFVSEGRRLSAYSLADGRRLWRTELPADVIGGLALSDGLLFVTSKQSPHTLYALFASNGSILYRKYLDHDVTAAPISEGSLLFLQSRSDVYAYQSGSGKRQWRSRFQLLNPQMPVSVSGNFVSVVHEEKYLTLLHRNTGKALWSRRFDRPIATRPVLNNDSVIVGLRMLPNTNDRLLSLKLANGQQHWAYDLPLPEHSFASAPSLQNGQVLLSLLNKNGPAPSQTLLLLDADSAQLLWQFETELDGSQSPQRPVFGEQFIPLTHAASNPMLLIDSSTGESTPFAFTAKKTDGIPALLHVTETNHARLIGPYLLMRYVNNGKVYFGAFN